MIQHTGLRATCQRSTLAWLLFGGGNRHITAEMLAEEVAVENLSISLATIYNTLNQFCARGLLREVVVDGTRTYFDTNLSPHHHFYIEETRSLIDIEPKYVSISQLPENPKGYTIGDVEVLIRLQKN